MGQAFVASVRPRALVLAAPAGLAPVIRDIVSFLAHRAMRFIKTDIAVIVTVYFF